MVEFGQHTETICLRNGKEKDYTYHRMNLGDYCVKVDLGEEKVWLNVGGTDEQPTIKLGILKDYGENDTETDKFVQDVGNKSQAPSLDWFVYGGVTGLNIKLLDIDRISVIVENCNCRLRLKTY